MALEAQAVDSWSKRKLYNPQRENMISNQFCWVRHDSYQGDANVAG